MLALRAADHHAAKLRYICVMTKGMGKIVLREVGNGNVKWMVYEVIAISQYSNIAISQYRNIAISQYRNKVVHYD